MSDTDCIGICIMEGDYCIGCGRSSEEIYQSGADAMQAEQQQAEGFRVTLTPPPPVPQK